MLASRHSPRGRTGVLLMFLLSLGVSPELSGQSISWEPINGSIPSTVTSFCRDSTGRMFAGTETMGVFILAPNGFEWRQVASGLTEFHVTALRSPNKDLLLAGTVNGLFRSTDAGEHWTEADTTFDGTQVTSIASFKGRMFVGTLAKGVWTSADGGRSWQTANEGLPDLSVRSLCTDEPGTIYAGCTDGIAVSRDGARWTGFGLASKSVISIASNAGGVILAVAESDGIYRCTDQGRTWERKYWKPVFYPEAAVSFLPDGTAFFVSRDWVARSDNRGDQWINCTPKGNEALPRTLGLFPAIGLLLATTNGLYRSTDNGDDWTQIDQSLLNKVVYSLAINSQKDIFVAGNGMFRSPDYGLTWSKMTIPSPGRTMYLMYADHADRLFTVSDGIPNVYVMYRSTDRGVTWLERNQGLDSSRTLAMAEDSTGNLWAATYSDGLFRSTDGGGSWEYQYPSGEEIVHFNTLTVASNGTILAGSEEGVYRSTDQGKSWAKVPDIADYEVYALAADGRRNTYAALAGGILARSTDCGNSWVRDFPSPGSMFSLAVDSRGHLLVLAENGIWLSIDEGRTWMEENAGLRGQIVTLVGYDRWDLCYAGTQHGLFRSRETMLSVPGLPPSRPATWRIVRNHPNPFSRSTLLTIESPGFNAGANHSAPPGNSRSRCVPSLLVYDRLGRLVKDLSSRLRDAVSDTGPGYRVQLDAGDLPSAGVYFCILRAPSLFQTARVVYVK